LFKYHPLASFDDIKSDPWLIVAHSNLVTAEMMTLIELSHHDESAYEKAVAKARDIIDYASKFNVHDLANVGE
jgi:hypothetical protein